MTTEDFAPRSPNMLNDILNANSKYAESFDKPMTLGAKKKVIHQSGAVQQINQAHAAAAALAVYLHVKLVHSNIYTTSHFGRNHVHLHDATPVGTASPGVSQCYQYELSAAISSK
jgi:hypothetical protein